MHIASQVRLYLRRLAGLPVVGALVGAGIGGLLLEPPLLGAGLIALTAAVDCTAIGVLVGGVEHLLLPTRIGRALERLPLLTVLAIKGALYGAFIVWVLAGRLGPTMIGTLLPPDLAVTLRQQVEAKLPVGLLIPLIFLVTAAFLVINQLSLLVGDQTFHDIVLGRYHRARSEERFFLFIDIAGSTPLAERIGAPAVHHFLDRIFQLASDPIDACRGEVYQYVGDEMVVTWTVPEERGRTGPLQCYFAIEQALAAHVKDFICEFGVAPRLRAALHAGTVITGEVGGSRRAIVFHGDVLNTASRIENATRELQRPFLASADALDRIEGKDAYTLVGLGDQALRGREAPVRLYEVLAASSERGSAPA